MTLIETNRRHPSVTDWRQLWSFGATKELSRIRYEIRFKNLNHDSRKCNYSQSTMEGGRLGPSQMSAKASGGDLESFMYVEDSMSLDVESSY